MFGGNSGSSRSAPPSREDAAEPDVPPSMSFRAGEDPMGAHDLTQDHDGDMEDFLPEEMEDGSLIRDDAECDVSASRDEAETEEVAHTFHRLAREATERHLIESDVTIVNESGDDDEDVDSSESEIGAGDVILEPKWRGRMIKFLKARWLSISLFFLGIVLIVAGEILERRGFIDRRRLNAALTIVGSTMIAILFSEVLITIFDNFISYLLRKNKGNHKAESQLTTFSFYFSNVRDLVVLFVWIILVMIASTILSPTEGDGNIAETWQLAQFHVTRLCAISMLVVLAIILSRVSRIYFVQDFGIRTYSERAINTISHELLLSRTCKFRMNPRGEALYRKVALRDGDSDRVSWQNLIAYIETHHVDGFETSTSHHVPPPKGIDSKIDRALPAGVLAFRRLRHTIRRFNPGAKRSEILREDFITAMKEHDPNSAINFGALWAKELDTAGLGMITQTRMVDVVEIWYQERIRLGLTFVDSQAVIKAMDAVILSVLLMVVVIFSLILYNLDVFSLLASLGTIIIGWSFIFGNAASSSFENIIYLFGVHPFDVGDQIQIGEDRFQVYRISLLATDLMRNDGSHMRVENKRLPSLGKLINFSTSQNAVVDMKLFLLCAEVTEGLIEELQQELLGFVEANRTKFDDAILTGRQLVHPLQERTGESKIKSQHPTHAQFTIRLFHAYPDVDTNRTFRDRNTFICFMSEMLTDRGLADIDLKKLMFTQKEEGKEELG